MRYKLTPIILGCGLLGMAIIGYTILSFGPSATAEQARGLFLYIIPITQLLFQYGQDRETQQKLDQKLPEDDNGKQKQSG